LYVHVETALSTLDGDARRLWSDAASRRVALERILVSWEQAHPDLDRQVAVVDDAVAAGLNAAGLPRGPIRGVRIEAAFRFTAGRKDPDCWVVFNGHVMRDIVRVRNAADDFWRTWVHESIHGRRPSAAGAAGEARLALGIEEGLVEGLARLVVRDMAGMLISERSYAYYVAAYETLAAAIGVNAAAIWRALWPEPTGGVRAAFAGVVDRVRHQVGIAPLRPVQSARLRAVADRAFATSRRDTPTSAATRDAMLDLWRIALA
jgi:hypothetical protein